MFLAPVVQTLDSAIHRIKIYPVDNAIGSPNTYPLDSDLSSGQCYPTFEQPGPGSFTLQSCKTTAKKCTKKACSTCKNAFLLIRPIVVFHHSPALPSPLSITRFYISFEQTIISGGRYYQNFTVLTERVTTWIFTGTLKRLNTHLCQQHSLLSTLLENSGEISLSPDQRIKSPE